MGSTLKKKVKSLHWRDTFALIPIPAQLKMAEMETQVCINGWNEKKKDANTKKMLIPNPYNAYRGWNDVF